MAVNGIGNRGNLWNLELSAAAHWPLFLLLPMGKRKTALMVRYELEGGALSPPIFSPCLGKYG